MRILHLSHTSRCICLCTFKLAKDALGVGEQENRLCVCIYYRKVGSSHFHVLFPPRATSANDFWLNKYFKEQGRIRRPFFRPNHSQASHYSRTLVQSQSDKIRLETTRPRKRFPTSALVQRKFAESKNTSDQSTANKRPIRIF